MTAVVEWAPFRLTAGTSEADLLRASDELQGGFLSQQPGFVRRALLCAADGGWVDVVEWVSRAAADAAMLAASTSPACHRYFLLMANVDHQSPEQGVQLFERRQLHAVGS